MERRNASTLLDGVLEAGRADEIALITEEGMVSYGELGRMVAAVGSYSEWPGRAARAARADGARRLARVSRDVPRRDADRRRARSGEPDGPGRQPRLLPRGQLRQGARDRGRADAEPRGDARRSGPDVQVVVVGGEVGRHTQFDYIVADGDDLRAPADTHQDDMAFWLYSSGSTGRPKGVVHSHRNIGVTADTYARNVLRIGSDDICYSTTKLFHAYGLGNSLSFPMSVGRELGARARAVGARSHLRDRRGGRGRRCSSRCRRCTRRWSGRPGRGTLISRASARAVSAAEPLPAAVFARWHEITGVPILDGIGSTEMLHIYCSNTMEDLHPGTSGRPVPGYRLRIVDEQGVDAPPGRAGRHDGPRGFAARRSIGTSARRRATA